MSTPTRRAPRLPAGRLGLTVLLLLVVALLGACGGDDATGPPETTGGPPPVDRTTVGYADAPIAVEHWGDFQ